MKFDVSTIDTEFQDSLLRLDKMISSDENPRIAVFGKYNHGKSTLLNAIFGYEAFKSSDKRETIENLSIEHNEVMWIDTPGLDAGVYGKNDAAALNSAFEIADYLLLVHQVSVGALDSYELDIFNSLAMRAADSSKKMCLVITQIDQKTGDELKTVAEKIQQQIFLESAFQNITIIPISSAQYLKGMEENNPMLCKKSGFSTLLDEIEKIKMNISKAREDEKFELMKKLKLSLRHMTMGLEKEMNFSTSKLEVA